MTARSPGTGCGCSNRGVGARESRPYNREEEVRAGVELAEEHEVLESVMVGMDPVLAGFAGVLVELVFGGERYALAEIALGSGNRLLRFRSRDPGAAYALLEAELMQRDLIPL